MVEDIQQNKSSDRLRLNGQRARITNKIHPRQAHHIGRKQSRAVLFQETRTTSQFYNRATAFTCGEQSGKKSLINRAQLRPGSPDAPVFLDEAEIQSPGWQRTLYLQRGFRDEQSPVFRRVTCQSSCAATGMTPLRSCDGPAAVSGAGRRNRVDFERPRARPSEICRLPRPHFCGLAGATSKPVSDAPRIVLSLFVLVDLK